MKIREEFTCPLELVQDMIKGKWKPIIIWFLQALEVMQKIGIEYMIEHGRKCVLVEKGIISDDYVVEK